MHFKSALWCQTQLKRAKAVVPVVVYHAWYQRSWVRMWSLYSTQNECIRVWSSWLCGRFRTPKVRSSNLSNIE